MVVSGQQAEVYIEDLEVPALFIPDLKRKPEAGNYYTSRDYRYLFSRRHMNFLHNPARQVGADRQQRQADGGEPFHHRLKMGAESTIPGKVDRSGRTFDDKTQPKRCI